MEFNLTLHDASRCMYPILCEYYTYNASIVNLTARLSHHTCVYSPAIRDGFFPTSLNINGGPKISYGDWNLGNSSPL